MRPRPRGRHRGPAQVDRELTRYPDGDAGTLRQAIAEAEGLPAAQIICGAGSMELLGLIAQAYLRPGDEALMSRYGYLYFRSVAAANGADVALASESGSIPRSRRFSPGSRRGPGSCSWPIPTIRPEACSAARAAAAARRLARGCPARPRRRLCGICDEGGL
jgi:Histidinol-phosphate/aromatic aminotransferase and cobyric acid decarboxylase